MRLSLPLLLNLLLLLSLLACKDLELGEPPEFTQGFTATAISESQIELKWAAGTDDFNEPDELRYGIWFAESADDIDLDGTADIVTEEGALGYSLSGLSADTDYHVIVRARDRGNQYSAAETTDIVTRKTPAAGAGTFGADQTFDITDQIDQMISGVVFNGSRDDLGLIAGTRINWRSYDVAPADGGDLFVEAGATTAPETIVDAHLVHVRPNVAWDDLFVATANNLYFYFNGSNGFQTNSSVVGPSPVAGSVRFGFISNNFEALAFRAGNNAVIYTPVVTSSAVTWEEQEEQLLGNNASFELADIDNDGDLDIVSHSANGVAFFNNESSDDDAYNFAQAVSIDADFVRNADEDAFLVADGDNDGNLDLYIFTKGPNETFLRSYKGKGDGTFANAVDTDLKMAVFSQPSFQDVIGNAGVEFLALQENSNNVAIHQATTTGIFQNVTNYLGGRSSVDFYAFGDLDGQSGVDLALFSNQSGNRGLTVILGKPSQTSSTEGDGSEGDGGGTGDNGDTF